MGPFHLCETPSPVGGFAGGLRRLWGGSLSFSVFLSFPLPLNLSFLLSPSPPSLFLPFLPLFLALFHIQPRVLKTTVISTAGFMAETRPQRHFCIISDSGVTKLDVPGGGVTDGVTHFYLLTFFFLLILLKSDDLFLVIVTTLSLCT